MSMAPDVLIKFFDVVKGCNQYLRFDCPPGRVESLVGATIAASFHSPKGAAATVTAVGSAVNPGTALQKVAVDLTAAQTALLTSGQTWYMRITGTRIMPGAEPSRRATLLRGIVTVKLP